MARSRRERKKGNQRFSVSVNVNLPTVSLVLLIFSIVGFYIANDSLLIILISWGMLISALIYLNTFWLGAKEIFAQQVVDLKAKPDSLILILNGNSELLIDQTIQKLKQSSMVSLVNENFTELPYDNESYDFVIVNNTFQDIRPHVKKMKALQEAARVIKKGGRILIIERGLNSNQYRSFLKQAGFSRILIKNVGPLGWWSGPWCPTNAIKAQKW